MESVQNNIMAHANYYMLIPAILAAAIGIFMFLRPERYATPAAYKQKFLRNLLGEKGYMVFIRFVLAPLCLAGSVFLFLRFFGKV